MSETDLIPLKQVLAQCAVSRVTLWRALSMEAFPKPIRKSGRLFWKPQQIEAIKKALAKSGGRAAFDARRLEVRRRIESRYADVAELKKARRRRRRSHEPTTERPQRDLFEP